MVRSLDETCAGLGADGPAWRRLFGAAAPGFDELARDVLGPVLRWPDHPVRMARFGLRAGLPATVLAPRGSARRRRGRCSPARRRTSSGRSTGPPPPRSGCC